LTGLWATVYQRAPLLGNVSENGQQGTQHPANSTGSDLPANDAGPATPAMDFNLGTVALDSIWLDYRNTVSALFARLDLGSLRMEADQIDLPNQRVTLDELQLDQTTAAIRIGKKAN